MSPELKALVEKLRLMSYAEASQAASAIEAMGAELEQMPATIDILEQTRTERDALRLQVEALAKDAARYRWLGEHCHLVSREARTDRPVGVEIYARADRHNDTWTSLDAAIDAAISREREGAECN